MSRAERLAELLKKEIANILLTKINDHRIGFVSLTGVSVSPDLTNARIQVSIFGSAEEKKKSLKGLISSIPFIRGILAEILQLRVVPRLRFVEDDSIELASQRMELINKLTREREAREKQSDTAETKA